MKQWNIPMLNHCTICTIDVSPLDHKICNSHFEDVLSPVFIRGQKHTLYNGNYQILSNVLLVGLHRINGQKRRDVMFLQFEL